MGMTEGASQKPVQGQPGGFPEDYHEYVFKDGRLVGDFDNMYRYAKGIPWDQDKRCHDWYAEAGMLMVKEHAPYESILEVGCGLGYVADQVKTFATGPVDAFDISSEAIKVARELHPGIDFWVADITDAAFQPRRSYDLVVVREFFWYVFPHMERVIRHINACVGPQGFLYIGQSFPALDRLFVGKGVIPHPDALLAFFPNYEPLYTARIRNHRLVNDGPILHFLGMKVQ